MNCEEGRLRRLALTLDRDPVEVEDSKLDFLGISLPLDPARTKVGLYPKTNLHEPVPFLTA